MRRRAFIYWLNTGRPLPNLGAFVPPGSTFDSMASAPGRGRRPGKAMAGKKGKCIFATSYLTGLLFGDFY